MKNHFYVLIEVIIALSIIFLCGLVSFILFAVGAYKEDIGLAIFLTIMLIVLPSVLLIWGIYAFAARITIDEKGILKSLFGIRLKYYKWEDIDHIKTFGNITSLSISFFKKRKENAFLFRWVKYERIYFPLNKTRQAILEFYAPDFIKEQLKAIKEK